MKEECNISALETTTMLGLVTNQLQSGNSDWMKDREQALITSSRYAAVLGISSYHSKGQIFDLLTGRKTEQHTSYKKKILDYGKDMEPRARSIFLERLRHCNNAHWSADEIWEYEDVGFVFQPDDRRFGASPDGLLKVAQECTKNGEIVWDTYIVEIKCPWSKRMYTGQKNGFTGSTEWQIPYEHLCQIYGQIEATDARGGFYAVFTGEEMYIWWVPRHREFWTDYMYPELVHFVEQHVMKNRRPGKTTNKSRILQYFDRSIMQNPDRRPRLLEKFYVPPDFLSSTEDIQKQQQARQQ